jgi:hypothetical protein
MRPGGTSETDVAVSLVHAVPTAGVTPTAATLGPERRRRLANDVNWRRGGPITGVHTGAWPSLCVRNPLINLDSKSTLILLCLPWCAAIRLLSVE